MARRPQSGERSGVSIVAAIIVVLTLAAAATGAATLLIAERLMGDALDRATRDKAALASAAIAERVRAQLAPVEAQTAYLADRLSGQDVAAIGDEAILHWLQAALAGAPQVSSVALVDSDLTLWRAFQNRPEAPTRISNWSDDSAFAARIEQLRAGGAPVWGEPFYAETTGETLISHFAPFRDRDGADYTVIASVSLIDLSQFLATLGERMSGALFILHGDRAVLAHAAMAQSMLGRSDEQPLPRLAEFPDPTLAALWAARAAESADTGLVARNGALMLYQTIEGYGAPWRIGGHFPEETFAPHATEAPTLLIWGAALIGLAAIAAFAIGRGLSQPLSRLAEASQMIRDWKLDADPSLSRSVFREINLANDALHSAIVALRSLNLYLPKTLPQKIMSRDSPDTFTPEAHQVTVLFTDIAGFTSLSEGLPAAEVAKLLNDHFNLVAECVWREEGIVDKFIGDSVMAFWGGLRDDDRHARHACLAAARIARALAEDNARRREAGLRPILLRIGIHTGEVVAGNIGAQARANYTIIGDTVNTAKRLEALGRDYAAPEKDAVIVLSGETAAEIGDGFMLEDRGANVLYGRVGETRVFELLGVEDDAISMS